MCNEQKYIDFWFELALGKRTLDSLCTCYNNIIITIHIRYMHNDIQELFVFVHRKDLFGKLNLHMFNRLLQIIYIFIAI